MLDGVRLIFRSRPLLGAISLDLMAVLFGGATALLPVFARDILHVGAAGNGILRAAPGVGAVVVGALHLGPADPAAASARTLFAVVALFGPSRSSSALSAASCSRCSRWRRWPARTWSAWSCAARSCPLLTPPELRGRVGAVERVFIGASNELGAFESGVAAALIGGGARGRPGRRRASIVVAGVWAWRLPRAAPRSTASSTPSRLADA